MLKCDPCRLQPKYTVAAVQCQPNDQGTGHATVQQFRVFRSARAKYCGKCDVDLCVVMFRDKGSE